jgi:hypothetical protein
MARGDDVRVYVCAMQDEPAKAVFLDEAHAEAWVEAHGSWHYYIPVDIADAETMGDFSSVPEVGNPTDLFKHKGCLRCQTERANLAGQRPGDC